MSHFAKINLKSVVENVIVAEQDFVNVLPGNWVQTSYNTHGNVHYGQNGQPDGGVALRGNFAGIGYIYDPHNDVFYEPQPYPSWTLNQSTWTWEAPTPMPQDGKLYTWDEATQSWVLGA